MDWKCQRCDEKFDTEDELKKHQNNKDLCPECCHELTDEEWIIEGNDVPYGDTYATEHIVVGFQCRECGHSERF